MDSDTHDSGEGDKEAPNKARIYLATFLALGLAATAMTGIHMVRDAQDQQKKFNSGVAFSHETISTASQVSTSDSPKDSVSSSKTSESSRSPLSQNSSSQSASQRGSTVRNTYSPSVASTSTLSARGSSGSSSAGGNYGSMGNTTVENLTGGSSSPYEESGSLATGYTSPAEDNSYSPPHNSDNSSMADSFSPSQGENSENTENTADAPQETYDSSASTTQRTSLPPANTISETNTDEVRTSIEDLKNALSPLAESTHLPPTRLPTKDELSHLLDDRDNTKTIPDVIAADPTETIIDLPRPKKQSEEMVPVADTAAKKDPLSQEEASLEDSTAGGGNAPTLTESAQTPTSQEQSAPTTTAPLPTTANP